MSEEQEVQDHVRALMRRLQDERIERGMTHAEIAAACGVTKQRVGAWERGGAGKTPKIETLERMARVMGYKIEVRLVAREEVRVQTAQWEEIGDGGVQRIKGWPYSEVEPSVQPYGDGGWCWTIGLGFGVYRAATQGEARREALKAALAHVRPAVRLVENLSVALEVCDE